MGVVYLAEDTVLGRRVAIKTLTARGGDNQHFRTRFLREARAVSALSHPHIAHIYDYGETDDDEPYICGRAATTYRCWQTILFLNTAINVNAK